MSLSNIPIDMLLPGVELSAKAIYKLACGIKGRNGSDKPYEKDTPEDRAIVDRMSTGLTELRSLLASRGPRYHSVSFANFQIEDSVQQQVVEHLVQYGHTAEDHILAGTNVVLLGPKGTGKDHLVIALAKLVTMETGIAPTWINGIDLYQELRRDAIDREDSRGNDIIRKMKRNPILIVSDPFLPAGILSEFLQNSLYQIVDYRYSHQLPTWITLNAASGEDASQRLGYQTVDRWRHDALVLSCNWQSFRKPRVLSPGTGMQQTLNPSHGETMD